MGWIMFRLVFLPHLGQPFESKKMKEILVSMKVTYVSGKPERPTAKKPNLPATTATSPSKYF